MALRANGLADPVHNFVSGDDRFDECLAACAFAFGNRQRSGHDDYARMMQGADQHVIGFKGVCHGAVGESGITRIRFGQTANHHALGFAADRPCILDDNFPPRQGGAQKGRAQRIEYAYLGQFDHMRGEVAEA